MFTRDCADSAHLGTLPVPVRLFGCTCMPNTTAATIAEFEISKKTTIKLMYYILPVLTYIFKKKNSFTMAILNAAHRYNTHRVSTQLRPEAPSPL
jgi:hypothetical protein